MLTYTEQVHTFFGGALAAMGALAWWSERHPDSPARLIWPAICFMIGLFLFVPVDVGTGQYQPEGPWDTFISVVPDSAAYWVQRWVRALGQLHVFQHKLAGLLAMVIGTIEYGRASGRLTRPVWAQLLPVFSIAVGLTFGIHGGTHQHLPTRAEQAHHWLLGVGFVSGGVVLFLVQRGRLTSPPWRAVWPIVVIAMGLDLAFFYRLTRLP